MRLCFLVYQIEHLLAALFLYLTFVALKITSLNSSNCRPSFRFRAPALCSSGAGAQIKIHRSTRSSQ